jgi:hypothetical protein
MECEVSQCKNDIHAHRIQLLGDQAPPRGPRCLTAVMASGHRARSARARRGSRSPTRSESMPCPSCSRRFGKEQADLAPTACRGRSLVARARRCCARCSPHLRRDPRPDPGLLVSHQPALGRVSLLEWFEGERVDTRPGIRKRAGPTLPGARMIWSCLRNRSRAGDERTPRRARLG